jgi:hypothetical protein
MSQINIQFKDAPVLEVLLNKDKSCELFLKIFKNNLANKLPIFRDPASYTKEYLRELSIKLKKMLGWNWMSDSYSIDHTVEFHKDLENFLEKEESFKNLPGPIQHLLHETHFCIHAIQYKNDKWPHGADIQIEWFNNDYEILPEDAVFKIQPEFGDVFMQNPYVGHGPFMCWLQNDYKNISRTCTYHDRIKPGLRINLTPKDKQLFDWKEYENWWRTNCKEFVEKETYDRIKKYTGTPILGKVKNIDILTEIIKIEILKIDKVEVIDD